MIENDRAEDIEVADEVLEIPIVRDGPLARYAVDTTVSAYLGRNVEVSLLSYTPRFEAEIRTGNNPDSRGIRVGTELLELARLRISPDGAVEMALGILQRLVDHGLLAEAQLRTEMDRMISRAPSERPSVSSSGRGDGA